jgi:N-acetyl-gamma-glutamyl-phosphate reductase
MSLGNVTRRLLTTNPPQTGGIFLCKRQKGTSNDTMKQITVGIFGAAGYAGQELVRLLTLHPQTTLKFATSTQDAGQPVPGTGLTYAAHDSVEPGSVDAIFLAMPHTASAPIAAQAAQAGTRVVDLSADLRMDTPEAYQQWYDCPHPAPQLLPAPYGLPEINRAAIAGASVVANPGCYPTATLLGLYPLLEAHALAENAPIIVDAKSGVSGAGRAPKANTHFVEVFGNLSPYNVGRKHRHTGEIEQEIGKINGKTGPLIFTPHLTPVDRGLMSTIYVELATPWTAVALQSLYEETYADEPLVDVLPLGQLATLKHAVRLNNCAVSITQATETHVVIVSVIDNLLKGAASQALQNFNLMFGIHETAGLL